MTDQTGIAALDFSPAAALAADGPELSGARSDATLARNISDAPETNVASRPLAAFKGAVIRGARLLWAGLLYGAVGLAGWLIAEAAWPTLAAMPDFLRTMATQESADRAAFLRTTQKMEEEIRALRAEMEAMRSSMQAATPVADAVESLGKRMDAMKTETGAAIGALSSQVEGLQRDAAKPAQTGERSDRTERAVVESSAPRTTVSATVRVGEGLRRPKVRRGDAFEPSKYPNAPGAPRSLGAYPR
ncbi:hypothetical protein [Methylocystis sp.]|uniref:hypothetical protein n=1 Tax=Methylocystis sp. TaxID=1911079 RepID=UPI0025CB9F67|nr:hypothetical protein [Methylocystis sp.]